MSSMINQTAQSNPYTLKAIQPPENSTSNTLEFAKINNSTNLANWSKDVQIIYPEPENKNESIFDELTRRIPKDEMQNISTMLNGLENKDENISKLKSSITKHDWKADIFQNPLYPHYALAGLREGKLTLAQFSTILFYHAQTCDETKTNHMPLKAIPLFIQNEVNPEAKQIIEDSFENIVIAKQLRSEDKEKLFNALMEKMRSADPSECIFFVNETQKGYAKILKEVPANIFAVMAWGFFQLREYHDGTFPWIMPSLTLMQAFQDVFHGEEAVTIRPVLGLSSAEDMLEGIKKNQRDLAIHFPGVSLPDSADRLSALRNAFTKHDEYHIGRTSRVGNRHRAASAKLAEVAKAHGDEKVYERFIDFDYETYNRIWNTQLSQEELCNCFWQIFYISCSGDSPSKNETLRITKYLIEEMLSDKSFYEENCKIPLDSLSIAIAQSEKQLKSAENYSTRKNFEKKLAFYQDILFQV